jgi:cytochrome b561
MTGATEHFSALQRVLHWLMALMVLSMLFIGVGMVSTLAPRYWPLISIHKPLGICILILVLARIGVRLKSGSPTLPADLPRWQAIAAKISHYVLYALMVAMPLIGWAMLSAGGYPIVLYGPIHLPPIMPHDDSLYSLFRVAHFRLAYFFFVIILMHLGAALFHALVRRDGVFKSMTI